MKNKPFKAMSFPYDKKYIDVASIFDECNKTENVLGAYNARMRFAETFFPYIITHLLKLESMYSTKIEGTQTTLEKIYESETLSSDKEKSADIKEVNRYLDALILGAREIQDDPITNKLIKNIHHVLLDGDTRKNSSLPAGEFRTLQNKVGIHLPPIASEVPDLMGNLERYINDDLVCESKVTPLVSAALVHAQFETIHPFPDGNGRVGRVLIPLYLFKQGKIDSPYFFLSPELEKNKGKYYTFLQGTREKTKEGFTNWIVFFLRSIQNQVQTDILMIDRMDALYKRVKEQMKEEINSSKIELFLRTVFTSPVFSIKLVENATKISRGTIHRYVSFLEKQHVVFSDQKERNRTYYLSDVIDVLRSREQGIGS